MMHNEQMLALATLISSTAGLSRVRRLLALLTRPRTLAAGVRAALRLQRVRIALPDSAAGHEIEQALRTRQVLIPNSLAAGLLELPDQPDQYVRGRKRQALRTNMRRAQQSGMTCREAVEGEVPELLSAVLAARGADESHREAILVLLETSPNRFWVAEQDGAPVGLAALTVAGDYAYIAGMLSVPSVDPSAARYLMSGFVFQALAGEGVRAVLTGSRLGMSPGLIYFQERLGFEPRRLVVA